MNENPVALHPIALDARRDLIDMQEIYREYRRVLSDLRGYRGGMTWKKAKDREYLFKIRDRRGHGDSLGPRSPETERIFEDFHRRKNALAARKKSLEDEIGKRARVLRARGLGRIPRAGADVLRVLDHEGLLNEGLTVLGTYALYAYEARAGVHFQTALLATGDVDILYDSRKKLRLRGAGEAPGMLGLLKKADRSFEAAGQGHFRAVNDRGFMVEFLTQPPRDVAFTPSATFSNDATDLVPAEMPDVRFLVNAPRVEEVALDEGGRPVFMRVPDPRYFAMNKLWMASKSDRARLKARRDGAQARAVAALCTDHLGLAFDREMMQGFPRETREAFSELLEALDHASDDPDAGDDFEPAF